MSHDVAADALNMIKNAKIAGKENVKINRISNLLIEILKIMKQEGAIKKYRIDADDKSIQLTIGDLLECKAVKPRFTVKKGDIEKYRRRYLPSTKMGTLIISTNKGLITHEEAEREKIGGCLIAYFY
ncbi:MAG TPA: 30S ribosomal protein S8 [Candidatus Nanoarchaeia archaeon]|nr:30S ribosomal protein S8 [Candidatus Nanoarchaeia archaeon]